MITIKLPSSPISPPPIPSLLVITYSFLKRGPFESNDVDVSKPGFFLLPIVINLFIIFLFLLAHSGHNRLSSRSGGAKVQAGNMKREVILLGVSGTQVWPAWNCRRTQPSVSAKSGLPWTTHHRTPRWGKTSKYKLLRSDNSTPIQPLSESLLISLLYSIDESTE